MNRYRSENTNRTPWTDLVTLISAKKQEDAAGYYEPVPPSGREIFCTFIEGVSRAEYYEAAKAGFSLSGSVEIWEDDYAGEKKLAHEGKIYDIGRAYPTGRGTLILYVTEVV